MPAFSVKKPLTVFVAVLVIIVLGVVAYWKMTPDLLPNMDFPYVIIVTADPGASPEKVEADVTRPMEQSMATLERIKSVTSSSSESVSMVVLEFENGVNMDTVSVDVQQKITALQGQWDDAIAAPYVLKINPSMLPAMVAAVSYEDKDVYQVSEFVEDTLEAKLTGVTGVASVEVSGTVERQIHLILDQKKLDSVSGTVYSAAMAKLEEVKQQLHDADDMIDTARSALEKGKRAAAEGVGAGVAAAIKQARDAVDLSAFSAFDPNDPSTYPTPPASGTDLPDWTGAIDPTAGLSAWQDAISGMGPQFSSLQKSMSQTMNALKDVQDLLSDDAKIDALGEDVGDTVEDLLDALILLTKTEVQLDSAFAAVEEGLNTIRDSVTELKDQTDVGSLLSISTLSALLTAQDFSMPAGYIDDNSGVRYMVSVGDRLTTREELEDMVLFDLGLEGVDAIRLKDVAQIIVTDNTDEIYTKLNGDNGVIVSFTKQSNCATAAVCDNLNKRFAQLEEEFPGLHFVSLMDQGQYIRIIVNSILSSLLWGALFSVLVLFLFLRDWRPTLITLVSIPLSVIFAIVLMYFSGVTINMISLSGLAVAVGMLVDNSVVVIENIYRLRQKGATVVQAAVSGAGQVLGAITASTLTTVCVFFPIVFVEGLTRQLFTDLALTMCYSLLASLLVALTLVPAMASGLLRREYAPKKGLLDRVYPHYEKALRWSLDHKAAVLASALALLIASGWAAVQRGYTFMPDMDMNMINITVTMPEDADMAQAAALADEVSRRAMEVDNVEAVGAMISAGAGMDVMSMTSGGSLDATLYVTLPEGESGFAAGKAIVAACEDLDCTVTASGAMAGMDYLTGSGVSVNLFGDDMESLQDAARAVAARMERVEGMDSVSDGLKDAAQALHISVDRDKAMAHGMTVAQVYLKIASALSDSASGADVTLDSNKMSMVFETDAEGRVNLENLLELEITPDSTMSTGAISGMGGSSGTSGMSGMGSMGDMMSGMGDGDMAGALGGDDAPSSGTASGSSAASSESSAPKPFKLGDIATVEKTVSLNTINHDQQRRYVTVSGQIADDHNVTLVTAEVEKALDEVELPEGVTVAYGGESEQIMEAMSQLLIMLGLGVLLVYLIMVAQFQSLKSPFIVMFTIPLAFTGGFLALLIAGIEISVVSMIGFVMLVGIIVNNGIVLVDYINQQRLAGMERREAIVDAGVTRMRPILMTSLTTILGLMVMALARNVGTAMVQPVALVCIGGLAYATLMTLFVVPCMYDVLNKKELRSVSEAELKQIQE